MSQSKKELLKNLIREKKLKFLKCKPGEGQHILISIRYLNYLLRTI